MNISDKDFIPSYKEQVKDIYKTEYQERLVAMRNKQRIDSELKASLRICAIDNYLCLYLCADNFDFNEHCLSNISIPEAIVNNINCDLSIALMVFYKCGGISFLYKKGDKSLSESAKIGDIIASKINKKHKYESLKESFLNKLYDDILNGKYLEQQISYIPPIGYIEKDTLKRRNPNVPIIFLEKTKGELIKLSKIWYKEK